MLNQNDDPDKVKVLNAKLVSRIEESVDVVSMAKLAAIAANSRMIQYNAFLDAGFNTEQAIQLLVSMERR